MNRKSKPNLEPNRTQNVFKQLAERKSMHAKAKCLSSFWASRQPLFQLGATRRTNSSAILTASAFPDHNREPASLEDALDFSGKQQFSSVFVAIKNRVLILSKCPKSWRTLRCWDRWSEPCRLTKAAAESLALLEDRSELLEVGLLEPDWISLGWSVIWIAFKLKRLNWVNDQIVFSFRRLRQNGIRSRRGTLIYSRFYLSRFLWSSPNRLLFLPASLLIIGVLQKKAEGGKQTTGNQTSKFEQFPSKRNFAKSWPLSLYLHSKSKALRPICMTRSHITKSWSSSIRIRSKRQRRKSTSWRITITNRTESWLSRGWVVAESWPIRCDSQLVYS